MVHNRVVLEVNTIKQMNKLKTIIIIAFIFVSKISLCQFIVLNDKTTEKEFIENWVKTVTIIKKGFPMKIDNNTILDSVSFIKSKKIMNYYYTMNNMDLSIQNKSAFNEVGTKKIIDENLKNKNTSPYMKKFNVQFFYYYYDKNGIEISKLKGDF